MNFKQKLGYMCIGCLFAIAGYILASLGGGATHAQQNEQVIDKIVCRELEVVNEEGQTVAIIGANEDGGAIEVFNTAGVINKKGRTVFEIFAIEDGGIIRVFNKAGKLVVGIGAAKNGGHVSVSHITGKRVVSIGSTEDAEGYIQTRKDGWRTH